MFRNKMPQCKKRRHTNKVQPICGAVVKWWQTEGKGRTKSEKRRMHSDRRTERSEVHTHCTRKYLWRTINKCLPFNIICCVGLVEYCVLCSLASGSRLWRHKNQNKSCEYTWYARSNTFPARAFHWPNYCRLMWVCVCVCVFVCVSRGWQQLCNNNQYIIHIRLCLCFYSQTHYI